MELTQQAAPAHWGCTLAPHRHVKFIASFFCISILVHYKLYAVCFAVILTLEISGTCIP